MLTLRVEAASKIAEGIKAFTLVNSEVGQPLVSCEPGSHIDVHMANGITRQYSITDTTCDDAYHISVNRDPASRGGSVYMHEELKVGDLIQCSEPRNNFVLNEEAERSVFIAGGIGITPIISMIRRLALTERPWKLYFCTTTRARTPFISEFDQLAKALVGDVEYIHDGENGGRPLDIASVVSAAQPDTHFYCCGPMPLMDAFAEATRGLGEHFVHTEFFSAPIDSTTDDDLADEFVVVLQKSRKRIAVPADKTILEAQEAEGIVPFSSCREGICGTCETRVLDGLPKHNDFVLTPEEQKANKTMMLCVSRAYSKEIVLDI